MGRVPGRSPPTGAARGGGRSDVEGALHRFIRLLRLRGMRISTAEAIDAFDAATAVGVSDRPALEVALDAALLKDRRDVEVFADTFARFFGLRPVVDVEEEHGHAHDDLVDSGELQKMTWSPDPAADVQEGHSHGKPVESRSSSGPRTSPRSTTCTTRPTRSTWPR